MALTNNKKRQATLCIFLDYYFTLDFLFSTVLTKNPQLPGSSKKWQAPLILILDLHTWTEYFPSDWYQSPRTAFLF